MVGFEYLAIATTVRYFCMKPTRATSCSKFEELSSEDDMFFFTSLKKTQLFEKPVYHTEWSMFIGGYCISHPYTTSDWVSYGISGTWVPWNTFAYLGLSLEYFPVPYTPSLMP